MPAFPSDFALAELLGLAASVKGDALLTYDIAAEVAGLAVEFHFQTQAIAMKNTHHEKMTELLIGKDLQWVTDAAIARESE